MRSRTSKYTHALQKRSSIPYTEHKHSQYIQSHSGRPRLPGIAPNLEQPDLSIPQLLLSSPAPKRPVSWPIRTLSLPARHFAPPVPAVLFTLHTSCSLPFLSTSCFFAFIVCPSTPFISHSLSLKFSPASGPNILMASRSYALAASSSDSKLPMWRARFSSLQQRKRYRRGRRGGRTGSANCQARNAGALMLGTAGSGVMVAAC